ncbi:nuclear pore complex protein Nup205 isoform X2 [Oratosquilla oratoria]|uniref:nuclear pore complex protein Nup205 isoform X1 n=1 Tax=Oratosquilla oratoria TaxID=337810 RepID=UPI003F75EACF
MTSSSKGMWGSMMALGAVVQKAVGGGPASFEVAQDLDMALQRHRSNFISLLRNPPKNPPDRSTLLRSVNEAVTLPGYTGPTKLPEMFVKESLILSDMYDLNEMSALSLLRAAEEERTLYPGVPRGLIAILLYYDSREQLVLAFKTLVQARQGISWVVGDNEELSATITGYTDQILGISLADRILELINNMEVTKELKLLQDNRAIGDAKHRMMVLQKYKSVRTCLADIMFSWAAQTPLKKEECRRLIAHLSKVKLSETGNGTVDSVSITLLMALVYSLEVGYILNAEDVTEAVHHFPITSDKTFVTEIHQELRSSRVWETPGLKAVVQLAWAVSLSNLRQVGQVAQLQEIDSIIEEDEAVLEEAVKGKVFEFLEKAVISSSDKPLDTFYCNKLHTILSDFIICMPERVKTMKNKADENSRQIAANLREGLQSPTNLEQPFEELLSCLAALYRGGQCGDLVEEYWCPSEFMPSAPQTSRGQGSRQVALFKFVRLPGDFLPPPLFIPYINLLTSLSTTPRAAQYVFGFLRLNSQPQSQGSNVSWDHFIQALTQYYNNLRVEHMPGTDTVYRNWQGARGITPQETQGLRTVLQLITQVADQDELARVALCDNAAWSPIIVFVGLLGCGIPLAIKTELLNALAVFSKSQNLASKIWQAVEGVGLVPIQSTVAGYSSRGLEGDIEELECSHEEFPLTRAFLRLMLDLVCSGVPPMLGVSTRMPGLVPYLVFVRDKIFFRHDSRTYKDVKEQWKVARGCLMIFLEILQDYTPSPVDVAVGTGSDQGLSTEPHQPGYVLLVDLVQDSRLLKMMLSVLHDGVQLLNQYTATSGMEDLHESLLLVLKIFSITLGSQKQLLNMTSEHGGTQLLLGIDKMLMSMNPRTGICDHMLNIAHLIGHHVTLPHHAELATAIIKVVGTPSTTQSQLLSLFTAPATTAAVVRHHFVECLDHVAITPDTHSDIALVILDLLQTFLRLPGPNLAHFLLGYTNEGGEMRTDLLDPGIRGFPRTVIHAVINLLPSCPPPQAEAAYHLIFSLCSHPSTCTQTLRYLRSSHDFLYKTIGAMPLPYTDTRYRLLAQGWVLRCMAIELRYQATHQQRSQVQRLIQLLVSGGSDVVDGTDIEGGAGEPSVLWTSQTDSVLRSSDNERSKLLTLLDRVDLTVENAPPPHCEYFTRVDEMLKHCDTATSEGKMIDIKRLHYNLQVVLQEGVAAAPLVQKDPLQEEVQTVVSYAMAINRSRSLLAAHKHFLEAWKQLVEVVVAVCPPEIVEAATHHTFLHTLTLELIKRVHDDEAQPDLSTLLVSTILLLVTTLRSLYSQPTVNVNTQYVSLLDHTASSTPMASQFPSSLQLILKDLVDCVLCFKQNSQSVRASIYAALLNYLLIRGEDSTPKPQSSPTHILLRPVQETQVEQFHRENYDVLQEKLPHLIDVLSSEFRAGHDVCKMLSLSILDALVAVERKASVLEYESQVLRYMTERDSVRELLDSLLNDDRLLVSLLTEDPDNLRPMYVFEAKMALLARFALTPVGARTLLQSGLMSRMGEMKAFDCRPDDQSYQVDPGDEFLPSVTQRYQQILFPALRMCLGVCTVLGSENYSASTHVMHFLVSHVDAMATALRPPRSAHPSSLEELALITATVAGATHHSHAHPLDPAAIEIQAQMTRLQQLMLALIPHFLPSGRIMKDLSELPQNKDGHNLQVQAKTSALQVLSNCITYARNLVQQSGQNVRVCRLLFRPTLDAPQLSTHDLKRVVTSGQPLTLGVLVECMNQACVQFKEVQSAKDSASSKLHAVDTAQHQDLEQYINPALLDQLSPLARRRLAATHLTELVAARSLQLQLAAHTVEGCVLLLWRHLEYFILHSAYSVTSRPEEEGTGHGIGSAVPRSMSPTEVSTLKAQADSALQEVFPLLEELDHQYSSGVTHVSFLGAAVRRIKRLLKT